MAGGYTLEQVQQTYKRRDAWWTVLLVDPLVARLVKVVANRTSVRPNQLTAVSFLVGLVAAALFWQAGTWTLVAGAVAYYLSFAIDCMDGKVARLKGTGSILGAWLDYGCDRVRILVVALALFGGQFRESGNGVYLALACVVVFLDMLRSLNSLESAKIRVRMNDAIAQTCAEVGVDPVAWLLPTTVDQEAADQQAADQKAGGADRGLRAMLLRRRIRVHLFSGIELQMFVFVVGPITGWILGTTVVSIALFLAFEVAAGYSLVRSVRRLDPLLARIRAEARAAG